MQMNKTIIKLSHVMHYADMTSAILLAQTRKESCKILQTATMPIL